jgi:hypothetical protein
MEAFLRFAGYVRFLRSSKGIAGRVFGIPEVAEHPAEMTVADAELVEDRQADHAPVNEFAGEGEGLLPRPAPAKNLLQPGPVGRAGRVRAEPVIGVPLGRR